MLRTISRPQLHQAMGAGSLTIVDALPPRAYQRRHLPGAVNLAAEDIGRAADLLPGPAAAVVVYSTDAACARGPELAELLTTLGYQDVRLYAEGIEDWVGAGLPVEAAAG